MVLRRKIDSEIVDANTIIKLSSLPTNAFYWKAIWINKKVVQGTWVRTNAAFQMDYDDMLLSSAGYLENTSANDGDEIHFGNVSFNKGTYLVRVVSKGDSDFGRVQVMLGDTVLVTQDWYIATPVFNQEALTFYRPTQRVSGNLRIKVNGKNALSTGYKTGISRIEIFAVNSKITNNEIYASAAIDASKLSIFSTVSDVTGSRAFDTVYQNTTGKPMLVYVVVNAYRQNGTNYYSYVDVQIGSSNPPVLYVGGTGLNVYTNTPEKMKGNITFVVPPLWYYKITQAVDGVSTITISHWTEQY